MGRIDEGLRVESRGLRVGTRPHAAILRSSCGLQFAFCILQFLLIVSAVNAGDLQWRRGLTPAASSVAQANTKFRRDPSVRQAAWGETTDRGPGLSSAAADQGQGQATLRSVIVSREDVSDAMRSAQLPPSRSETAPGVGGATAPPGRDELLESLQRPFDTQTDAQRGFRTPDVGAQPGADALQLPTERPIQPPPLPTPQPLPDQGPVAIDAKTGAAAIEAERLRTKDVCSKELEELKTSTLANVKLDIRLTGTPGRDFPFECSIDTGEWHAGRSWPGTTYMWKASALCHKPLYFEDEQMERYGHSWGPCCDPIVSGVHFFSKLPVLPYCMGVEPPCECIYALGHYRPGSCAPYYIEPVPISCRGALFQAGAVVGVAAVLP